MEDDIFKISKDYIRAKDLIIIAKERLDIIKILPKDKPYKIIEEYYEIIIELITSIMYCDGYKTLNHKSLIKYLSENFSEISEQQVSLIENLRKSRHGIVYYGKKITEEFLVNQENMIKLTIKILISIAEKRLNNGRVK